MAGAGMRIGMLGYGEVGQCFAAELARDSGLGLAAYDRQLDHAGPRRPLVDHAVRNRVTTLGSALDLAERSELIVCAVTVDQALAAAESAARASLVGKWFLDVNSTSPATKVACAAVVNRSGGRYVDAALMTAVPARGLRVQMLLGGPQASLLEPLLTQLGFSARTVAPEVGVPAAIKMCRSVVVKGLEAVVIEGFTAARALGVEEYLLASLQDALPGLDWDGQADHLFARAVQQGRRRAGEMRCCAETVAAVDVPATMAEATARRHAELAGMRVRGAFAQPTQRRNWRERADEILLSQGHTLATARRRYS